MKFLFLDMMTSSPPLPAENNDGVINDALIEVLGGIGIGATLVLIGICVFLSCYRRRKKKKMMKKKRDIEAATTDGVPKLDNRNLHQLNQSSNSNQIAFEELAKATDNFSEKNLIGKGGFGYVHRGVLCDGRAVAIKQLKSESRQGEREFQAEIEVISRVHHRHLVTLLGYCITGSERLLVYEFVPNKTLEFHLHEKGRPVLEWSKRVKIALGTAKGLAYLHEYCKPKTIHRDVKTANILIDDSFEAKLADFGLARASSDSDTHVSTRIMGTFGYLSPEYACSGKLTDKSDVFSYGVVLLELITGRRPIDSSQPFDDDERIVDWATPLMIKALNDGNFDGLVDPNLDGNFDIGEMKTMVACAAASIRHTAKRRPKMSQIVRAFEGNISLDDLTEGVMQDGLDYNSARYEEDLIGFQRLAFESIIEEEEEITEI